MPSKGSCLGTGAASQAKNRVPPSWQALQWQIPSSGLPMAAGMGKPHDLCNWRGDHSLESLESPASIGRKRNLACEQAAGEFIAYRDDHDWYASDRLCHQGASGTDECGQPTEDGFRKDGPAANQPPGDPGGGRRV